MLALFLALWLLVQPAQPPLTAEWRDDRLVVQSAPGCLYLVGGGLKNQLIDCDRGTYTLLPYGDQNYAPMGRELVLRNELAQTTTARLLVPSRVVKYLPMVAN